ncbi:MAG: methionine--tRNA ligase [Planctomycetes bacterium]|jgi:methionyl-tRNA synthetase|nr:methionine--tRNA ligase [Planctomycetota bacterium]MCL4729132.1 methionine--tRNA ligase [Planctomycetota bacterium]
MNVETPVYITTPLYYVNDELHIGHATTTLYADTLARFWRACGRPVLFLTGSDEHGQKIHKAATAAGTTPKAFADRIVGKFFELWERLDIQYDIFIRTTDDFHKRAVQALFTRLRDAGHIRKDRYNALYCVDCETNYTEKDLVEGKCPIHKTTPQQVSEENYFFALSRFTQPLLEHIAKFPDCIVPEPRRNEIVGKLKDGLNDISVTRTTFDWGVPLPWEPQHVIWVWWDALVNYISGLGWPDAQGLPTDAIAGRSRHGHEPVRAPFAHWWPHAVHLVGKDILWHHSVVWWSQLLGAGVNPPRQVFAHGWWQVEGDKMSKTLGNVIRPLEIADKYGRDALRWHVLREGPAKGDADWRQAAFITRYNADLANGLGNLVNRSLTMLGKYFAGKVPAEVAFEQPALERARRDIIARVNALYARMVAAVTAFDLDGACEAVFELVRETNAFVNNAAPFKLAKDPARANDLQASMHTLCQVCFVLCHALRAFLPDASARIADQLGIKAEGRLEAVLRWNAFAPGHTIVGPQPLFARLETGGA